MSLYDSYDTKAQRRAVDFLKLYDTYFTSANVKVYLQSRVTGKMVQVDAATGVGYNYTVSSVPIHVLGTRTPVFLSRGNGVGEGSLVIAFKDALYLKAMIKYIFDETMDLPSSIGVTETEPNVQLPESEHFKETVIAGVLIAPGKMDDYMYERYQMWIRQSNLSLEEKRQGLIELEKRRDLQRGFKNISDEAFKIISRTTSAHLEQKGGYIEPNDVLDIGGIHMLFDIRIVLNNTTPYYNNTDTTIVLRDCKIVSDRLDTSSLQDGIIQQAYNFIFKTVSAA